MKLKNNIWLVQAGIGCIILVCYFLLFPLGQHYNQEDYRLTADVVSSDNLIDPESEHPMGEQLSKTRYYLDFLDSKSVEVVFLKEVFDVQTPEGERIIKITKHHTLDVDTGRLIRKDGDNIYLFAPKNLNGRPFKHDHINLGVQEFHFVEKEDIQGLETYHYVSNFSIDQTDLLGHVDGVPDKYGILNVGEIHLWFEPETGLLVDLQEEGKPYYYDIETGEKLGLWNHYSNKFTHSAVANQVNRIKQIKQRNEVYGLYIPLAMVGIILILVANHFIDRKIDAARNTIIKRMTKNAP